jgi:hypothetical protein
MLFEETIVEAFAKTDLRQFKIFYHYQITKKEKIYFEETKLMDGVKILDAYYEKTFVPIIKRYHIFVLYEDNRLNDNELSYSISRYFRELIAKTNKRFKLCIIILALSEDRYRNKLEQKNTVDGVYINILPINLSAWEILWRKNDIKNRVINTRMKFLFERKDESNLSDLKNELISIWQIIKMIIEDQLPIFVKTIKTNI